MSILDEIRRAAIRDLPAFPRTLFLLHNFHDVGVDAMAERLTADQGAILACLAEARALIHRYHRCARPARFDPMEAGLPFASLERRLRLDYRARLETAFAGSGYSGTIVWPDPSADIAADEEAAATFILSCLPVALRDAVARSRRPGTSLVDLWRIALPWRRIVRDRLLQVTNEFHCSGWEPFDIWLANRIAPDRHYPGGYPEYRRSRRPLPHEPASGRETWMVPYWPENMERQHRFDSLPRRTQDAYALFHVYGRNSPEIARRLGITRRSVKRRIRDANYMLCGWPLPSFLRLLRFELGWRRDRLKRQARGVWAALRD